jgi:dTDP-4-amino-4,6-dideoxygalactose transaminase
MFEEIFEFEKALARFTGAPYAVMTDCCTHAIELCLRLDQVSSCEFTAYTYISIPQTMTKLGIDYCLTDETWQGEYQFRGTRIWDSARRLEPNMYRPGQMQCLSFGFSKPIDVNRGGAILLDDEAAWRALSQMRSDGRNLRISPWEKQTVMELGFHYRPTIEEARRAHAALALYRQNPQSPRPVNYPDCRNIFIKS